MTDANTAYGFVGPAETDEYNKVAFIVRQVLGHTRTVTMAKIIKVHNGDTAGTPTLDVQPMINQVDSQGNSTPHDTIYGISCARGFGGINGVICDPVAGDVGLISVMDRDMSSLKANAGAQSNPGSGRRFDFSDAIYHGATYPTGNAGNYINLNGQKIHVVSPNEIVFDAPGMKFNGYIKATGNITAGFGTGDSVEVLGHIHGGVVPGGGNTAAPVAGS